MSQTHRFHETRGNDIMVYHNWVTARRTEAKDNNGLVFTSKPVKPNEKISIKLLEVSDKLPGVISIGFTSHDPSTLQCDLPKSSELKGKSGFWVCSLSRQHCVKGKVLFFCVTTSGNILYGIDDVEKFRFHKKVDTGGELWGFVDIWSPPTTIEIYRTPAIRKIGYKFTPRSIHINEKVFLKMLQGGRLSLGVTSCDPALLRIKNLPNNPDSLLDRTEYWVVINDPTWKFEKNDELNYVIAENGEMKIWKNSSLLVKVIHVDQTLQLWGFFACRNTDNLEITLSEATPKEEKSDCVLCCENVIEAALYPCGHMCMCFECAKKQWRGVGDGHCPMCRVTIKDVLKIYKN